MEDKLIWKKDLIFFMAYECTGHYKGKKLYQIIKMDKKEPENFAQVNNQVYALSTRAGWDHLCKERLFVKQFDTLGEAQSYAGIHLNQELKNLETAKNNSN